MKCDECKKVMKDTPNTLYYCPVCSDRYIYKKNVCEKCGRKIRIERFTSAFCKNPVCSQVNKQVLGGR
ncbi:hypothetical protein HQ529_03525 [Candidatus Woesearchaeota archaeon]|nr:hypothetical protein [Candidatus Woesearchaeota archaeon]